MFDYKQIVKPKFRDCIHLMVLSMLFNEILENYIVPFLNNKCLI